MTAEDLTRGSKELASQTARSLARELQNDLDYARFKE
jgi:Tfp pilus assembly protein FimT